MFVIGMVPAALFSVLSGRVLVKAGLRRMKCWNVQQTELLGSLAILSDPRNEKSATYQASD
ncbi:hypothetical protein MB46_00200 [Arthrobacter alpinus]|nr:hypothetical protein MB46_00200 [Arthrobacter alpinus]